MPQHRDQQPLPIDLVNQMIRKLSKVAAPPELIESMERSRPRPDPGDGLLELPEESVTRRFRSGVVVIENHAKITPHPRMKDDPHPRRAARNSLRNTASSIPSTAPLFNSAPRRVASSRLSPPRSCGSAPSRLSISSPVNSARSSSDSCKASFSISGLPMPEAYRETAPPTSSPEQLVPPSRPRGAAPLFTFSFRPGTDAQRP